MQAEREAAGLSLATLATKLKVTKGYLSRLESDKATPSASMVERIAQAIGADPDPLRILAGYLPTDVKQILSQHPVEAPAVLRETFSVYATRNNGSNGYSTKATQPALAADADTRAF